MADSFEDKAQDVAVLGRANVLFGIPMPYVAFTLVIAFPLTFMVWWGLGLTFAVLSLFGLYHLHQADPQAVDIWIERLRSRINVWQAGRKSGRAIVLLRCGVLVALVSVSVPALAAPGYALPTSGATGILASIEQSMTEIANFISEPMGVFIVIAAFIFAGAMWVFSPRSGALAIAARAVAALVVVFNLTAILSYFTY